jgi:hypothetical protein
MLTRCLPVPEISQGECVALPAEYRGFGGRPTVSSAHFERSRRKAVAFDMPEAPGSGHL